MTEHEAQQTEPVRVYTPQSSVRNIKALLGEMWRDLKGSRDLAWRLLVRDISARYRQSLLGIFWAFIPPIVLAAGLLLAKRSNVISIPETDLPYAAYVMISMMLWQTFAESLNAPINALMGSRAIITKINFPREAILVAKLGEVLFNFSIKMLLIITILFWFRVSPGITTLLFPVALLSLIAFGYCIGLVLAPLAGLYLDVSKTMALIMGVWLFLTPIIYPVPSVGIFSLIVDLNPLTHLLVTAREMIAGQDISNMNGFLYVAGLSWAGLLVSWVIFRLSLPIITERMSA